MWCPTDGGCVSNFTGCDARPQIPVKYPSMCSMCSSKSSCSLCTAASGCGWCSSLFRCLEGSTSTSFNEYCSASNWYWSYCPSAPYATPRPNYNGGGSGPTLPIVWIILGVGAVVSAIVVGILICIRRRNARLAAQSTGGFELTTSAIEPSGDASTGFSYAQPAAAAFSEALPGYMYTTPATNDQPQYIYTAVPVGAPVVSINPQ